MKDEAKATGGTDITSDFTTSHEIDIEEEMEYLEENPEELEALERSREDYEEGRVKEFDSHEDLLE